MKFNLDLGRSGRLTIWSLFLCHFHFLFVILGNVKKTPIYCSYLVEARKNIVLPMFLLLNVSWEMIITVFCSLFRKRKQGVWFAGKCCRHFRKMIALKLPKFWFMMMRLELTSPVIFSPLFPEIRGISSCSRVEPLNLHEVVVGYNFLACVVIVSFSIATSTKILR